MLKKLKLQAGTYPNSDENLEIELSPVTVFIGPNNSGKSQALIEIEGWIANGRTELLNVISNLEFESLTREQVYEKILDKIKIAPSKDFTPYNNDYFLVGKYGNNIQIYLPDLIRVAFLPTRENIKNSALVEVLSYFTTRLDGYSRLSLVNSQHAGDLQENPIGSFSKLFRDQVLISKVRDVIYSALKKYLVIDPTNLGNLRLRLSEEEPKDGLDKRLTEEAIAFHKNAILVENASDGVKAFIGIIISLIAGESDFILVDEPEAFLHPTLSYKLGKEITSILNSDKRLFVATHSADFLMGCVQSKVGINIVRLTYGIQGATARILTQDKLKPLMQNPLLRSIGVFNALFYNAVIVTEADADRAFYQEINERLLREKDPRGIEGCLFLNAQNKQTVWDIVKPLRELGIPTVGIVDIDVIKEGGDVWNKVLNGIYLPELSHESYRTNRAKLKKAFDSISGKNMKCDGGINLLNGSEKNFCLDFFKNLSDYGCFVVPVGEIERWLENLDIERGKSSWLRNIFDKMGDDPDLDEYIRPTDGDVWDFIGKVAEWINDPNKKGIPK
ncbi:ATP-dependent nuclease [Rodentibacter pneumotropicus]|uniref:ATP-dependent nuclease n=1 Tax=Rodentibacter pneumotropicus TaxID=758 RepID=UPI00109CB93D|nr:ATP-binding protein [Rodentibacter pneumotropicus]THA13733.1 ATP-binding protein [Rodentibacter pneumotropicus]